jgi:hypothetical protein
MCRNLRLLQAAYEMDCVKNVTGRIATERAAIKLPKMGHTAPIN